MNENEVCYRILKDFQTDAGIDMETLAEAARMEPQVLQTCFDTVSKPAIGTFSSIASGLLKIMETSADETRTVLHPHYVRFVEEYVRINPDQFGQQSNPYFTKALAGLVEKTGRRDLQHRVNVLLQLEKENTGEKSPNGTGLPTDQDIQVLWNCLNDSGRRVAGRLLQEISEMPEFRR